MEKEERECGGNQKDTNMQIVREDTERTSCAQLQQGQPQEFIADGLTWSSAGCPTGPLKLVGDVGPFPWPLQDRTVPRLGVFLKPGDTLEFTFPGFLMKPRGHWGLCPGRL